MIKKETLCICPVCKKLTVSFSNIIQSPMTIEKEGRHYPVMPCPTRHKANDVRKALGFSLLTSKKNTLVKGAHRMATEEDVTIRKL